MRASTACALWLALACLGAGCASTPAKDTTTPPTAAGAKAVGDCDRFTNALCTELGNDTEPCMSMRNVREWLPETACVAANADMPAVLARVKELRSACVTLAAKLCADLGESSDECVSIKQDMPRVPAGHCSVLLQHYPELVAQLHERAQRDKPLAPELWQELLAAGAPSFGPEAAKVQIVEFSDFQCPYCSAAAETVKRVREQYADKVHFVFRQFPLSFHANARIAAQAALAAHAQGKFWPMHDRLFEHQDALDRASLEGYAKDVGLDVVAFKKSLDESTGNTTLEADIALGKKAGVDGTPSMFIDGKRVENPTDYDSVVPMIDAALAN